MKIAYIGLRGLPANYSGVEKAVDEISSRLKEKHDITVYCMGKKKPNDPTEYNGIKLKYVRCIPGKNTEMISYALFSTLKACFSNVDLIHLHAIGPASMSLFAILFGKKVVVTNHGIDYQRSKWGKLAKTYLKFGEWMSANFAHAVIGVSKHIQQHYSDKYKRKIDYVPNGLDKSTEFSCDALDKFILQSKEYILYVGRVTSEKNVHLLIQAFKNINTTKKLVIVGGVSDQQYQTMLNELCANNNRIIFTGPVYDRSIVNTLYKNAYLFVLPSEIEGLSIVMLEAMSFGCPILASNIAENKELLLENGYFFNSGSVTDLQNVLTTLLNSQETLKTVDVSNLDQFNWDKIAEQTEKIYYSCYHLQD